MINIKETIKSLPKVLREKITFKNVFKGLFVNLRDNGIFSLKEKVLVSSAYKYISVLENLEKTPVQFSTNNDRALQLNNIQLYITNANRLLQDLESISSEKASIAFLNLKRQLVAVNYRLEKINGGWDAFDFDHEQCNLFLEAAKNWKKNQIVFAEKEITMAEKEVLKDACIYPEFIKIALLDSKLLDNFLNWSLRDSNDLKIFIEYPALQSKIEKCNLGGRIGKVGKDLLKIQYLHYEQDPEYILEKVVTLPVEGKDENILDDHKVHLFRGNYSLTIAEIFKIFADKTYEFGNLEFSKDGIINWSSNRWGWWDADKNDYQLVDINQSDLLKEIPVFEKLNLKEARKKYGSHLDGQKWNLAITATRRYPNLDFEETHAFLSLAIPGENGEYVIYPFGKYSQTFPTTLLHALCDIGQTKDACISYPDENLFYNHRQHASYSFAITEQQGQKFLNLLKRDQQKSREENFVYQLASDNCARWGYGLIKELLPHCHISNFFEMYFLDCKPHGAMKGIFYLLKSFSRKWQILITTHLHLLFGAQKGMWIVENSKRVWKSLNHHSFWKDMIVFQPARLHEIQQLGLLGRFIDLGITSTVRCVKIAISWFKEKLSRSKELFFALSEKFNNKTIINSLKIQGIEFINVREVATTKGTG